MKQCSSLTRYLYGCFMRSSKKVRGVFVFLGHTSQSRTFGVKRAIFTTLFTHRFHVEMWIPYASLTAYRSLHSPEWIARYLIISPFDFLLTSRQTSPVRLRKLEKSDRRSRNGPTCPALGFSRLISRSIAPYWLSFAEFSSRRFRLSF